MWGQRQAWNLLACQNTGASAVHLDCRPDIITPHHHGRQTEVRCLYSCRFTPGFCCHGGKDCVADGLKSDLCVQELGWAGGPMMDVRYHILQQERMVPCP